MPLSLTGPARLSCALIHLNRFAGSAMSEYRSSPEQPDLFDQDPAAQDRAGEAAGAHRRADCRADGQTAGGGRRLETSAEALDRVLARLSQSAFRARFALDAAERAQMLRAGPKRMLENAREILSRRLASAVIANDGRQTPMRGYPVFKAQHATALCCRKCMRKWHGIPEGRALTERELDFAAALIMRWIERAIRQPACNAGSGRKRRAPGRAGQTSAPDGQGSLF